MADGWQALEREDLGGWRLRAAEGFTGRSNSVLPLGPPPVALSEAVDRVEQWYAERGLPARFCLPWALGSGPDGPGYGGDLLEAELVARGYVLDTPTIVMTRALSSRAAVEVPPDLTLDLRTEPDEPWLALYHYRGQQLPPVAVRVLTSAPAQTFVSLRTSSGPAVAVGRGASARGWTGISAVEVSPDHRRQGLAQIVMAAILAWGRDHGDHSAYLQVARANAPARALYDRLGFIEHSGYHYRIQPAGLAGSSHS
jgi:GNAT superfamily N-acetyltransferase